MKKRLISLLLALVMVATVVVIPANAEFSESQTTAKNSISEFRYEYVSDGFLTYTYEKSGITYKNIDSLVSENHVCTLLYQKEGDEFVFIDKIDYYIDNTYMIAVSRQNGSTVQELSTLEYSEGSWSYRYSLTGDVRTDLISVLAIALALAAAVEVPESKLMTIATLIFNNLIPTVYYCADVYKDLDSNPHRPVFKKFITYYTDEDMEYQIGDVVVHIWQSST